jgi:SAM-dependent methyltransferase
MDVVYKPIHIGLMFDIQQLRRLYSRVARMDAMLNMHFEGYKDLVKIDADKPARITNNLIKQHLIQKYTKADHRFLDLPCGSGNDVEKVQNLGLAQYVGIDLDYNNALLEAAAARESVRQMGAKCKLYKGNMCDPLDRFDDVTPGSFDVISCQFAMHYAFENEKTATGFMENIALYLKPGGHFIATYPDGEKILGHWTEGTIYGNNHYDISFNGPKPDNDVRYGAKYHFRLTTCVNDDEFLIRESVLNSMFLKQFDRVEIQSFDSFFQKMDNDAAIKMQYESLDADNREIVDLYKLCVFKKK